MNPHQALDILRQVVEQTNANANSHRQMQLALQTLEAVVKAAEQYVQEQRASQVAPAHG